MIEHEQARDTYVMQGGDYLQKGARVTPGTPVFCKRPRPANKTL